MILKQGSPIIHVFCKCEHVKPIWDDLIKIIKDKYDINFSISNFEKMFGVFKDNFITHLFLCVKYYIYVCKFRGTKPTFIGYTTYIKSNRETEYYIAKKRGKLSNHFKKWRF